MKYEMSPVGEMGRTGDNDIKCVNSDTERQTCRVLACGS